MLQMAFGFIASSIDRDSEKYQNIVERNRANIGKRWNKKDTKDTTGKTGKFSYSDTDNGTDTEKKKTKAFIPPTLPEIQKYFADNGYSQIIAERAFKGYEVANWIDSKGNQIKNWKQKCQFVWFKPENKNNKAAESPKQEINTPEAWKR